jgi:hypothetical protein
VQAPKFCWRSISNFVGFSQSSAATNPLQLLRRDRGRSTSQNVFLKISGRGLGKFFDEGGAVRRLEMREFCPNWTEFSISLVADSVYPTKLFASEILFSM